MHGGADAVAHVLPHHREPGGLGHLLDGVADVREAVALPHGCQPLPEALLGDGQQAACLLGDLADGMRPGRVAVVALDDGAAVDRDDVALLQAVLPWDAMHDHVVG